jgi:hypothetical protein
MAGMAGINDQTPADWNEVESSDTPDLDSLV